MIGEFSGDMKEFIVWDKVNAQPAIGEGILNSQFEVILVLQKSSLNPESLKQHNSAEELFLTIGLLNVVKN